MMEKLKDILNKYRFAVLVALAGVVLMLLPAGKQEIEAADTAGEEMSFSFRLSRQSVSRKTDSPAAWAAIISSSTSLPTIRQSSARQPKYRKISR